MERDCVANMNDECLQAKERAEKVPIKPANRQSTPSASNSTKAVQTSRSDLLSTRLTRESIGCKRNRESCLVTRRPPAEGLPSNLIRSKSDWRAYRYFTLPNGMRILLARDTNKADYTSASDNGAPKSKCFSKPTRLSWARDQFRSLEPSSAATSSRFRTALSSTTSRESESEEEEENWTDDDEASSATRMPSDAASSSGWDGETAAATLCIECGTFNDPPQINGLAHLLEHVLMQTKTDPFINSTMSTLPSESIISSNASKRSVHTQTDSADESLEEFLNLRGGTMNAFTGHQYTIFTMTIPRFYLAETLQRWSTCFKVCC